MYKNNWNIWLSSIEKHPKFKDGSVLHVSMTRETFREILKACMFACEKSTSWPELYAWVKCTESLDNLDSLIIEALADD